MPAIPSYRDVALLFMAAEVKGEAVLNYEHEESAILQATASRGLSLAVEESGSCAFLGQRLAQDGPFEALHLSCHGEIVKGEPVLALENTEGGLDVTGIASLSPALGEEGSKPRAIFLSACRTAEHGTAAFSFAQALIRSGVPNALGWDGSVYDQDAILFAQTFYGELAAARSVPYAAARARAVLLGAQLKDRERGRHWHLARVYVGPRGGGTLCAQGKPKRVFRQNPGDTEFLDKKSKRVPVATAAEFVGRRRQAQQVLRAFREQSRAGVLLWGMGAQGKSSLAARIANRMPGHEVVVIFDRYDALAVFDALTEALPQRLKADFVATWRAGVAGDELGASGRAAGHARRPVSHGGIRRPEPGLCCSSSMTWKARCLSLQGAGETATRVKAAYAPTLASIVAAFRNAEASESRLLITSRYTFALTDRDGDDLAAALSGCRCRRWMTCSARSRCGPAARLVTGGGANADARIPLERRIKKAAGGNPGLQALLQRPLLNGEMKAAEGAVAAVEDYLGTGNVPENSNAASDFFKRVSLKALAATLSRDESEQLRAAKRFDIPVPSEVLASAGADLSVSNPAAAIIRLQGLGLLDTYVAVGGEQEIAVNALVRPLVGALEDEERDE